jgi:hypothetical protein
LIADKVMEKNANSTGREVNKRRLLKKYINNKLIALNELRHMILDSQW